MKIKITLNKRKNSWGEYVIKSYKDGLRWKEADYYTDDFDDAIRTFMYIINSTKGYVERQERLNLVTGKMTFVSIQGEYEINDVNN